MKQNKLSMFVKRLPNETLYELFEILIEEFNKRKSESKLIESRGIPNISNAN